MKGVIETERFLSSTFKMEDLRQVNIILGIKVRQYSRDFTSSQSHYFEKVLKKFNDLNIKEASTPFDPSIKFVTNDGRAVV